MNYLLKTSAKDILYTYFYKTNYETTNIYLRTNKVYAI